ncbi:uncharacterized protein LOC107607809 [Arachis ipaensis]|uniref:uncharacterized protein LOC107607809 n=1 Tax=Arachis ipaensis TaxID=130454 RepID=UPI0007AF27DE|nr:uncharacterized protein LOC107607809 [Arachis ipaensis]
MDVSAQVNDNGHEEEHQKGTESGSEMGEGSDGDGKLDTEEKRPTWEEEMAENKEAWKLAVESGAQYSDEDDIMTILQEQNEVIAMKRRQAKQKEKARRSQPKNRKQVLEMLGLVETKNEVLTKFDVVRIWGSDRACWEFVGSIGSSGGLLVIWNETTFKLYNCYKGDRWLCLEGVVVKDNFHCAICLVYGPHERAEKTSMWEELSYIVGLCQVPFCFFGDFNEILHLEEKKGATTLSVSAAEFRTWINDMEGQSCSRIDRSLVSLGWLDVYPETRLRSGPRGLSDHCPLIMEDFRRFDGPRPFRSMDSWFTHEGFLRMVKKECRELGNVTFLEKMKALSEPLRIWHKQHFGDMTERIKRFEEEIRKVDDMVSSGRYDGTIEARRRALVRCCEKWYIRQDVHWKQMSRSRHATEMNRNTRYFHNIASARRRSNRIEALVINGRLVRNQARIKIAIRDFYKRLYHQEVSPRVSFRDGLVNRLEREEAKTLEALPSVEEVKEAVWDCESSKAPGSDGYNMNFIKKSVWMRLEQNSLQP